MERTRFNGVRDQVEMEDLRPNGDREWIELEGRRLNGASGTKGFISTMGGDIRLYRDISKPEDGSNETIEVVLVSFLQLMELNSNAGQVVDTSSRTHTIGSFSRQQFFCTSVNNTLMAHSSNVTADCLLCITHFGSFAAPTSFRLNACFIKNNGTITQQDEVSNVTTGQLKFSVELTNGWNWCDSTCRGGPGQYVELDIGIRLPETGEKLVIKGDGIQEPFRPRRFPLGSGSNVEFSTMVLLDGLWKSLSSNTPVMTERNGMMVVTLRFARFNDTLFYDPTIQVADKVPDKVANHPAKSSSALMTSYVMLVLAFSMYSLTA